VKLLKSYDNGKTWYRVNKDGKEYKYTGPRDPARYTTNANEYFFLDEFPISRGGKNAYPFAFWDFVQHGRDNSEAKDDYVYIYSPEGAYSHKLLLARVDKDRLGHRDDWEYFKAWDGTKPVWTSNINQRGYVMQFPDKNKDGMHFGWYSWLPSVVYNEGLDLYIMINGGLYAGNDGHYYTYNGPDRTGSLGLWYSKNPWGPWTNFYYTDYWKAKDPNELTYQPKLSPKWISEDGTRMVMIWSDYGYNFGSYYVWNQMEIKLDLNPDGTVRGASISEEEALDSIREQVKEIRKTVDELALNM
jgi:hypothetical protein